MWHVYALTDQNGVFRYIGLTTIGVRRRFKSHLLQANWRRTPCGCWIWSLLRQSLTPGCTVLEEGDGGIHEASAAERKWIAHYRSIGARLLNATDGGEGVQGLSEAGRKRLSESKIGRTLSEETRRKMSESAKHRPPVSLETRRKMSEALKGRPTCTPEAIARAAATNRGRKRTAESIAKFSAKMKGRPRPPEAVRLTAATNRNHPPEVKRAIAAKIRAAKLTCPRNAQGQFIPREAA